MGESGRTNEANLTFIKKYVDMFKGRPNGPALLLRTMKQFGVNMTIEEAEQYMQQLGGSPTAARDVANQAREDTNRAAGNVTEDKGVGAALTPGNLASGIGNALSESWHSVFGTDQQVEQDEAGFQSAVGRYSNPALDKVTQQYGLGNTVVYDPEGKPHKVDYSDQAQMEGLQSGDWKVAGASGEQQQERLGDDWQATAEGMRGSAQTLTDAAVSGATEGEGGEGGQFGLTPEAAQLLKLIPGGNTQSDSNTLDSNAGVGGSTHNNARPGNAGRPFSVPSG